MHKFYNGRLPSVCIMEGNNCTEFGTGYACLPFSNLVLFVYCLYIYMEMYAYISSIFSKKKIELNPPVKTEEQFTDCDDFKDKLHLMLMIK